MQERLQKKELALQGRHGSKIAEKLTEQRDSIARQLEEAKQELQMLESGKGRGNDHRHAPLPLPEFKHCPEYDEIKSAFNDRKTVLLSGGPARIDRIIEASCDRSMLPVKGTENMPKHLQTLSENLSVTNRELDKAVAEAPS